MGKSSRKAEKVSPSKVSSKAKRALQTVNVVVAQTGFPISSKKSLSSHHSSPRHPQHQQQQTTQQQAHGRRNGSQKRPLYMDLHQAKKEVRNYGATLFEGEQKRSFQDEQYKLLTGRDRKRPKIAPNIARNIRKKAEKRHEKVMKEAKEAGIVVSRVEKQKSSKNDGTNKNHVYGPAPSAGFVKGGVLHLSKKPF